MHINEERIWAAFREGKFEVAFNAIVDQLQEPLLRVIIRIVGDQDESLDILQDTFIKIWKNLKSFKGQSKWSTWTYRIATNEALMHLRKMKKWNTTSEPEVTARLEASSFFDGDEVIKALYKAMDTLPAKQRLVFQMRYFDELPYTEIESITGTSSGALKASYHHAVKKMETAVKKFKLSGQLNIKKS